MALESKTIEKDEVYLRQISTEIDMEKENYDEYIKLLEEYCLNNKVFAMAAVQIGIPKRIVYLKNTTEDTEKSDGYNERQILINPVVTSRKGLTTYWEACASCLDNTGLVERPYEMTVEYIDENKVKQTRTFKGFETTVLSHELDHLDGILHIDKSLEIKHMTQEERKEFRKIEGNSYQIISKDCEYEPKNKKLNRKI